MSVRIRLKRMGTHKKPYYRLVVADSRSPRDGRFIEMVGTYDPLKKPAEIKVDQAKTLDWLKKGAPFRHGKDLAFQGRGHEAVRRGKVTIAVKHAGASLSAKELCS